MIDTIAAELEQRMVAFMLARLEAMGQDPSGLYNYYASLARKGRAFAYYDVPVAKWLAAADFPATRILDVGAGIGQLSALLLKIGLPAVPIEATEGRYAAMVAMFEVLGLPVPTESVAGFFPGSADHLVGPDTVALFMGLMNGQADELERTCTDAALRCRGVVLDLAGFGRPRGRPEEQDELREQLEAAGLVLRQPVLKAIGYYEPIGR